MGLISIYSVGALTTSSGACEGLSLSYTYHFLIKYAHVIASLGSGSPRRSDTVPGQAAGAVRFYPLMWTRTDGADMFLILIVSHNNSQMSTPYVRAIQFSQA